MKNVLNYDGGSDEASRQRAGGALRWRTWVKGQGGDERRRGRPARKTRLLIKLGACLVNWLF